MTTVNSSSLYDPAMDEPWPAPRDNEMNFDLQPSKPAEATESRIVVDGIHVGELIDNGRQNVNRFHAILRLENIGPRLMYGMNLAQGHGPTPDEAIANAISCSRREAEQFLASLADLAHRLEFIQ